MFDWLYNIIDILPSNNQDQDQMFNLRMVFSDAKRGGRNESPPLENNLFWYNFWVDKSSYSYKKRHCLTIGDTVNDIGENDSMSY